jgi:hypothetical protein
MKITNAGYVGIGTTTPTSTLDIEGSISLSIVTTTANITLDNTHHTIIITGSTPTINLPAPSTCRDRIYIIVNRTINARAIGGNTYHSFTNNTANTIAAQSSITVQSDGTNWYQLQ